MKVLRLIHCYEEAKSRGYSKRVQLGCLLHDASESYISDLTRPVKRNLPEYFVIEEKLQRVIYERFGLGDLSEEELKQIDSPIFDVPPDKATEPDFSLRDFLGVEKGFFEVFNRLITMI